MSKPETDCVSRVVDVADLVADSEDADQEDVLLAALSKVRKRGGADE
jgi:hypothetical protein